MERDPKRLRDTTAAILFIVLVFVSSQRLNATSWTTGLGTAVLLGFLGCLLGVLLGQSRFKPGLAFLLSVGYTFFTIPLICMWVLYKNVPWEERLVSLGGQIGFSFIQLILGQPVTDPTLFIFIAGLGYWIIGVTGGYQLMRHGNYSAAVAPAGIVLIIIQLFDMSVGDRVLILAIYILVALLLLGRLVYLRNRQEWKEKRVWVSSDAITDLNIIFGVAALALVVMVWLAPVNGQPVASARIAWQNLTKPWRDRQQQLNNTIQSLHSQNQHSVEIYSDNLSLGTQAATGDGTVLRVRAPLFATAQRYYWQERTYDVYQDDQWFTDLNQVMPFRPSEGSLAVADNEGTPGEFVFTVPSQDLDVLVTPTHPVWLSRPSRVTYLQTPKDLIDPLLFTANQTVRAGAEYTVHANIYNPTVYDLRISGTNYPAWVTDHYLQLPDNFPASIRQLAEEIASGNQTPYDKTMAITNYLRRTIKYSTTVEPPPKGTDAMVWFLFNTQTGYCNYYATAEVLMLRSLGIPARLAVGFAQGEYETPNLYTVIQKDAHAWPEVYFTGRGWIEFEPTVSQAPLERAAGGPNENLTPSPNPQGTPGAVGQPTPLPADTGGSGGGVSLSSLSKLTIFFLFLVVVIAGGAVAYMLGYFDKLLDSLRHAFKKPAALLLKDELVNLGLTPPDWLLHWAYLAALHPVERSFAVVYRSLRWLGEKPSPARTPAEAAEVLKRHLPEAVADIETLEHQVEISLYSHSGANRSAAHDASERIWKLAWRASIRERWQAFKRQLTRRPAKTP